MLLWTDPGLKSGISVRDLKLVVEHSPKILAREEKATTPKGRQGNKPEEKGVHTKPEV